MGKCFLNKIFSKFIFVITLFLLLSWRCSASILDDCYKLYPYDADSVYMGAISAISSNNAMQISEMQSKNGYILFMYGQKYYLLTVTKRYKNQTEVKILPQNSDYSQGATVPNIVFNMLDKQLKIPLEQVK